MPKWPNHNGRESEPLLGISSSILFWSESVPNNKNDYSLSYANTIGE
jgi:hypothetical protein